YYDLLRDLYKTKVKTPLFPYEFFQQLYQWPEGRIFVVKYQGRVLGGSVCVELPNRVLYEWFVCGLDREIKNVYPSTLATWGAIEYAATHNILRFDMMGAGKPDAGYGVREFKAKFGGDLVEHGRYSFICNPLLYAIGKFGVKLLKHK
ncbi:MAG: peptidoglycan bridge formation glycyltransferase FemA/FemB family protein, partial [Lutibacter sp.]|nr:peptidoglycan bridge formation glycyltransferase FemA/FemB family protein [Lutibacter sp.]